MVKPKHIEWFSRGARTLRAVARDRGFEDAFPTDEDWYLCPVCLDVLLTVEEFATEQLSVEHVPPEALGGNELVLTCKRCNNDAGRHFDAEAHKQQRLRQFLSGHSQQSETATFTVGDIITRVEMHLAGQSGMFLVEVPKINNPADLERMEAHMRTLSETRSTDFRFTVTPRLRYFADRARVSWIRTAYQGETRMLDSPEGVCPGQAGFKYPATSVLFSISPPSRFSAGSTSCGRRSSRSVNSS